MAFGKTVYNTLFRRSSTFFVTILAGAFVFERIFDYGMDSFWDRMNRGVSSRALSLFPPSRDKNCSVFIIFMIFDYICRLEIVGPY